jgi:nucleotide-binding universal stress UspA family protein
VKLVRILLPINQSGTSEACAAAAFSLAERFGTSLEVLHVYPTLAQRLPYSTELSPLCYQDQIEVGKKQIDLEKRQAKKWLRQTAKSHPQVDVQLLTIEGLVAPAVALRAQVADLTVLPNIGKKEELFWSSAREVALFHSGRPLLVVPNEASGPLGDTVVIAWKNAVEAVRAVVAARPFLAKAKRVLLLSVTEGIQDENAKAMADYLTRLGLSVEHTRIALGIGEVGVVLLEAASANGALLVMGAYGRWRWREWVFGGATHYVLRNTTVPVLMMH